MTVAQTIDLSTPESTARAGADFGFGYGRTVRAIADRAERRAAIAFLEDERVPEWQRKLAAAGARPEKIAVFLAGLHCAFDAAMRGRDRFKMNVVVTEEARH